jgi:hypothetical protein
VRQRLVVTVLEGGTAGEAALQVGEEILVARLAVARRLYAGELPEAALVAHAE